MVPTSLASCFCNEFLIADDAFVDSGGNPIQISEDADGFLFAATGSIPLSDKLSLYGRLGAFFWDGESLIGNVDDNVRFSGGFLTL